MNKHRVLQLLRAELSLITARETFPFVEGIWVKYLICKTKKPDVTVIRENCSQGSTSDKVVWRWELLEDKKKTAYLESLWGGQWLALPTSCFFSSSRCLLAQEAGRESVWALGCPHSHLQGKSSSFFSSTEHFWWERPWKMPPGQFLSLCIFYLDCHFVQLPHFDNPPRPLFWLEVQRRLQGRPPMAEKKKVRP